MSAVIKLPVKAILWTCHEESTIADADGKPLADCAGFGRNPGDAKIVAAELVSRINAGDSVTLARSRIIELEKAHESAIYFAHTVMDDCGFHVWHEDGNTLLGVRPPQKSARYYNQFMFAADWLVKHGHAHWDASGQPEYVITRASALAIIGRIGAEVSGDARLVGSAAA